MRYIGQRVPRREDRDLVTGRARRVADLTVPGTLELAFTRSPVPHARVRAVEVTAARRMTGVAGVWSAADLPDLRVPGEPGAPPWPALATGTVRYPGEALAVVAADTRARAEDAAERVRLDLEPLPAVTDPAAATAADAPRLFDGRDNVVAEQDFGAPAGDVFATAPVVVEAAYRQQLLLPTSLEPRAILVEPGPDRLTVWVSHQAQHRLRAALATALGRPAGTIRVVVPATGGAFGAKSQTFPEYLVAAHLAGHIGRPVRWCEDRAEAMLVATRGRGQYQRVRLAADTDGTFLGYELLVDADIGGYPHTGAGVPMLTGNMSTGVYRTPRVHARVRSVLTTTAPTSAYRGAGRPEAAYALERTVDQLARRLRMDPARLRYRNLIRADQFPYRTPTGRVYDSGDYAAALDTALAAVQYDWVRAEQARRRRAGGWPLGIGLATYIERSGGPPDSDEYGSVEACADGTFVARSGSTATGQGHRTAFAQVVASALEVDLDLVRVVAGDTAEVPYGYATFGSRSMQVGGSALWRAAKSLVELARDRFAAELGGGGAPVSYVSYADGRLTTGDRSTGLGELVARTGPLRAEERFAPPQAFPFGAYAAVVEVDPELGTVHVRRMVAIDDRGIVVNPTIVDGQAYGSIAQGLGQALYEEARHGADGTPQARTLLDYLLPTAADMPPVTLLDTVTPNPNTPLGAKGAGEAGCIGTPPAVVNAVCDALDVDHIDMPLTPEAVWSAVRGQARPR
jgi:aerobic carbon-monoxide dehydrogenase large subunit